MEQEKVIVTELHHPLLPDDMATIHLILQLLGIIWMVTPKQKILLEIYRTIGPIQTIWREIVADPMLLSDKQVNQEVQLQVLDHVNQHNLEALMAVEKEDGYHIKHLEEVIIFLLLHPQLSEVLQQQVEMGELAEIIVPLQLIVLGHLVRPHLAKLLPDLLLHLILL